MSGERVEPADPLDLVAEELDAHRLVLALGGVDLDHVAAHAELPAGEGDVIPLVEHVHQLREQRLPRHLLAGLYGDEHLQKILRGGEAVNAGDAGDDNRIAAREQRTDRRQAKALDVLVDRGVFLDEGVRPRQVGLRLVVVEIADKIFHRIAGEELLELAVELGCERLVVGHDQRRAVHIADHICHGECLSRTGDTQQRLVAVPRSQRPAQALDRAALVPFRLVVGRQLETTCPAHATRCRIWARNIR